MAFFKGRTEVEGVFLFRRGSMMEAPAIGRKIIGLQLIGNARQSIRPQDPTDLN